jgi:arginyl-tRNA synthetase
MPIAIGISLVIVFWCLVFPCHFLFLSVLCYNSDVILSKEITPLMLKKTIADLLTKAIIQAQKADKIPTITLPEIVIERPQKPEHGDYASSIPLKLARVVGMKPMALAQEIIGCLEPSPEIASAAVAPPGFINFKLKDAWLAQQVNEVLKADKAYGDIEAGKAKKIQVEFVSVNPTGPLHVGHGRGAVLGSTLASVLAAAGYQVEKEYYINDAGNQIKKKPGWVSEACR